jgi:hypothetical protein
MGVLNINEQFEPVITGETLIEKRQFTRSAFNNVVFNNMTVKTVISPTNKPKIAVVIPYHLTWDDDTQMLTILPQYDNDYFIKYFGVCFEHIELHRPSLPEIDAVMTTEYLSTRFTDYPQVKSPYTYTYEG